MTVPVFYADSALVRRDGEVRLSGTEGHHAARVRRLRVGERVDLTDGRGALAEGLVAAVGAGELDVTVTARRELPAPEPRVVVVQALPKGDRGETAVETMTEIGVDRIVPWAASRCVTRWRDERAAKSRARWEATAHEAAKQSRRVWWPEIADQVSLREVTELLRSAALGVVLHETADQPLAAVTPPEHGDVVLVVGPEGGIDDSELAALRDAGGVTCRIGPSVLRTSTAGTVAAAVMLSRTARWR